MKVLVTLLLIVVAVHAKLTVGRRNSRKTRKKTDTGTETPAKDVKKDATTTNYLLDHSFDNGRSFQHRGKFQLRSYNTRNGTKWKVSFDEPGQLFANEPGKFENLVKSAGYYRVRVRSADSPETVVVSFIPACSLLLSKFKEYFMLRTDDFGNIMAMEYANDAKLRDCEWKPMPEGTKFRPKAVVVPATDAPSLPATIAGNMFYKDGQQAAAAGGKGKQPQQQQSFFQKYKYWIIGFGVIYILSKLMDPEALEQARRMQAQPQRQR